MLSVLSDGMDDEIDEIGPQKGMDIISFHYLYFQSSLTGKRLRRHADDVDSLDFTGMFIYYFLI